jgi:hypothetical protein
MVLMGYPYRFEELVVVDLPQDDRNELYRESGTTRAAVVDTPSRTRPLPLPLDDRPLGSMPTGRSISSTAVRASNT